MQPRLAPPNFGRPPSVRLCANEPSMTDYKPKPGSVADRAIDHLGSLPDGAEMMTTALAEAVRCPPLNFPPNMEAPIKHGLIFKRQRDTHVRSPMWWSLTDHSAKPRVVTPRATVPAQDGSADVEIKVETPEPQPQPKRIPPRSPVGGPLGAGQPAAAGPIDASGALRCRNAAWWLTGEVAIEAEDGSVIVLDAVMARRLATHLRPMLGGVA